MRNADVLDRILAGEQVDAAPAEVRELAQLASVLQGAWRDRPTEAATNRTRALVLAAFRENGSSVTVAPIPVARRGRRVVARLALVAALVMGLPAAAWAASENALPGQLLYPVKRGFEEVRIAIAGDPVDEARVLLGIAGERVEEAILATALGRGSVAELAREGYEEAVARFEGRIVEAQALGLPVQDVLDEAAGLFSSYQQVFDAIFGPPPAAPAAQPTEVLSARVPADQDQAADEGDDASRGSKSRAGGGGHERDGSKGRSGGADEGDAGDKGDESGEAGGAGGGGSASGGEDADDANAAGEDEAEGEHETEDGGGKGMGHIKAIGEGHQKDKGEGHSKHD